METRSFYNALPPDTLICTMEDIARFWGVSLSTAHRWRRRPEGRFFETKTYPNAGGGLGRIVCSRANSLQAYKDDMVAMTSEARRAAAHQRWDSCNVSSGHAWNYND